MNLKSFTHLGTEFRPCVWKDSIDSGARWYAVTFHKQTNLEYSEQHSPKFTTKSECRDYALDRARDEAYLAGEAK